MAQRLSNIAIVVRDYDEAIAFYCGVLGFELLEDTYQAEQDKRWVVVRPKGEANAAGTALVLARASKPELEAFIGNQAGGRVFLFLATDDFKRDLALYESRGVKFIREPKVMDYGTVAVFQDLYGNQWDLVQFAEGHPLAVTAQ
ncbi:VOC family protein [Rhizobium sp. L1K21]|uniref:VOC family protein n=1 Tax=Rhizobium sp. L1K21 TaxID=2954933 RepID=UPI0020932AEA|nr:VOC family protein [Rhizobium sp. L1K21]MCO6186081.1 VOC family protein [Rhizobium sp. L1K21]